VFIKDLVLVLNVGMWKGGHVHLFMLKTLENNNNEGSRSLISKINYELLVKVDLLGNSHLSFIRYSVLIIADIFLLASLI